MPLTCVRLNAPPTQVSELYDLVADPREVTNVFDSPQAQHQRLRTDLMAHLVDWLVLTADVTPGTIDSRGAPKFPFPIAQDPWAPEYYPDGQHDTTARASYYEDIMQLNGIVTD